MSTELAESLVAERVTQLEYASSFITIHLGLAANNLTVQLYSGEMRFFTRYIG